jgi:DNA-binding CsgD family transcriptional regulator
VRQRLAELQLDSADEPVLPFAKALLDSGATGTTVAAVLHSAARTAVADDPALAVALFEGTVAAGRPAAGILAEWAEAAALAGDLDTALRLADQAISGGDGTTRSRGARVAAAALAHRGQWARSAELYVWSGEKPFAEIASIAVGRPAARTAEPDDRPPTLLDGAAALMADGIRASVTGSHGEALAALVRSSALLEPAARDALLPDSPAALAVLVALHCGETGTAESVLDAAVTAWMGGKLMVARHQLLRAWIQLARGRLAVAGQLLADVQAAGRPLEPRDRLFAVALEVALARRTGDLATLRRVWTEACDCLLRHPVDLFTFLPLGELAVAAARLREPARLHAPLREAYALAQRLGNPALWVTQLHWSGLHAAIVAELPDEARDHAQQLAGVRTAYGKALAQAATCWIDVAAGRVDLPRVLAAARALLDAGLWWDSARLAGEAAIRTADRKAMTTLLDCARQVQARQQRQQVQHSPVTRVRTESGPDVPNLLSGREQEVADLVLQGMTYKEVGERLFISAKTVEHHMARMRHRLGAASRSELLTQLRALVKPQG